jgi:hypothetical protein
VSDQHTPGPWKLNWKVTGEAIIHPDFPELHYVAVEAPRGEGPSLHLCGFIPKPDAHLIVAAPDLLVAAQAIAAAPYGVALGDIERLNAAIAKALGKS